MCDSSAGESLSSPANNFIAITFNMSSKGYQYCNIRFLACSKDLWVSYLGTLGQLSDENTEHGIADTEYTFYCF